MVRKCSFSFRDEEVPRDFRWDRQVWLPDDDPLEFSEMSETGGKGGSGRDFDPGLKPNIGNVSEHPHLSKERKPAGGVMEGDRLG